MPTDSQRGQCSDAAFHCYGTAYIFEKRIPAARKKIRLLQFFGIAVPVALGIVAAVQGSEKFLPFALLLAGILTGFQCIVTVWSLVASWDTNLAYCIESKVDNYQLAYEFEVLALTDPAADAAVFEAMFNRLMAQNMSRSTLDRKFDISDAEKRAGMHAALWKYRRECERKHAIPSGIEPAKGSGTRCPTCNALL